MAVSTTYSATPITAPKSISTDINQQYNPSAVTTATGQTAVFYVSGTGDLSARLADGKGNPLGSPVLVSAAVDSSDQPGVAVLTNGNIVVTWANSTATQDVFFRVYDANLNPLTAVTAAETNTFSSLRPDVAALAGGGFAITWERRFNATDHDVMFRRFDASGAAIDPLPIDSNGIPLDNGAAYDERPAIAGLADGGFAIAFNRLNTVTSDTAMWAAVRNADGSVRSAAAQFDGLGAVNRDGDVVALPNGQFLVSYEDSSWTGVVTNADISTARFAATGVFQAVVRATQAPINDGNVASAVSPDGYTFINVTDSGGGIYNINGSLISPTGDFVARDEVIAATVGDEFWGSANWLDASHVMATYGANPPATGADSGGGVVARLIEISRATYGDSANDAITFTADGIIDYIDAGGGNDTINAGRADDTVNGGAGDDVVDGGVGADYMDGGLGDDTILVDNALDVVVEGVGRGFDTVRSAISLTLAAGAEVEALSANGLGAFTLVGNGFGNAISGADSSDILDGKAGNDVLKGNAGSDRLLGDLGDDTLLGDSGGDKLFGGLGIDQLTGNSGKDFFAFATKLNKTTNVDRITDFSVKDDTVWLDNAIFKKLGKSGTESKPVKVNSDFFTIGSKAADANDYLIYNKKSGALYYDADGSGKGAAILFAKLSPNLKLTDKDFYVI